MKIPGKGSCVQRQKSTKDMVSSRSTELAWLEDIVHMEERENGHKLRGEEARLHRGGNTWTRS